MSSYPLFLYSFVIPLRRLDLCAYWFLVLHLVRSSRGWRCRRLSWVVGTPSSSVGLPLIGSVDLEGEETTNTSNPDAVVSVASRGETVAGERILPLPQNPIVAMTKCPAYATLGKATKGKIHTYETTKWQRHEGKREREDMPKVPSVGTKHSHGINVG